MGITKLADLIRSDAPDAISYKEIGDYSGNVPDHAAISVLLARFIIRYVKEMLLVLIANVSIRGYQLS